MGEAVVEVVRGTVVESRHRVHVAVVDAAGLMRASAGEPEMVTFIRSAAKPFQALPVISEGAMDRFGITLEEIAVACGSHSGEPRHVEAVTAILRRIGLDGEALACGPHPPFDAATRRELAEAGLEPGRLHNNCSGKHAGMLALARVNGWDPEGYNQPEHPVQGRILVELERWLELPPEAMAMGTDGCAALTVGVPLRSIALGYAKLAQAARLGEREPTYVVGSMTSYPEMVAGEGRLCTDLMRCAAGRLFAKVGAEGVYCVGVPGAELGIALKVEDGAQRAIGPAILAILRELDLISEDDLGMLLRHAYPEVVDTRGEVVGQVRARVAMCGDGQG
jgi:L-asparaginase II